MYIDEDMIRFSVSQMTGFSLDASDSGDNRAIFSVIRALLLSAHGDALADCRKPLKAVLGINSKDKFMGCKTELLQRTLKRLFGDSKDLLSDEEFGEYNRLKLLEYLEICRRVFISSNNLYAKSKPAFAQNISVPNRNINVTKREGPKQETAMERAFREAKK